MSVKGLDGTANGLRVAIADAVDVVVDGARASFTGHVEFLEPFPTSLNTPGLGATAMIELMRSIGRNLIGSFIGERDGFNDVLQFLGQIGGPAVLHFEHMNPLIGQYIAVEHAPPDPSCGACSGGCRGSAEDWRERTRT